MRRPVQTSLHQICANAGDDGTVIAGKPLKNSSYDPGHASGGTIFLP